VTGDTAASSPSAPPPSPALAAPAAGLQVRSPVSRIQIQSLSLFSGVLCCTVACRYGRMAVGLLLPMSMFVGFQFYLDAESLKPSSDYLLHVVVWLLACCCPCP
jgi:cbb3-type cytochrome oxidase subunit 1